MDTAAPTGVRVLVVDDHPDAAEAACLLLCALGHDAYAATTGNAALAEVERLHPDVVICDIGLPDISGYELAHVLRIRHGAGLYLAALTGWDQPADRARALAAGFDQHVVKPANVTVLRGVIAASVEARSGNHRPAVR